MKRSPHRTPSDDGRLPHRQSPVPAARRIRFTPWAWPLATLATALCFLLGISAVPARADSGTFYATKDASISELDPDVPHTTTDLESSARDTNDPDCPAYCDRDGDLWVRELPLIAFDLSSIPEGATITSCELHVECWLAACQQYSLHLSAFRITSFWTENVTWYSKPTWTDALAPYVVYSTYGHVVIDHPDLAEIVQMWVDGTAPDHGLLLWLETDAKSCHSNLYSRETAAQDSEKPYLVVQYTPPEPPPPPPPSSPPQVLLEVHPNERGPGPTAVNLNTGLDYWTWPPLASSSAYTWKEYHFDGPANLWIQVCAQSFSAYQNSQNASLSQEDWLKLIVDGVAPSDFWGIQSGPPGSYQWKGSAETGKRVTLEFLCAGLTPGLHQLELLAQMSPIIYWVKVYDLEQR